MLSILAKLEVRLNSPQLLTEGIFRIIWCTTAATAAKTLAGRLPKLEAHAMLPIILEILWVIMVDNGRISYIPAILKYVRHAYKANT